jgi:predicted RND superfamily exporter protein
LIQIISDSVYRFRAVLIAALTLSALICTGTLSDLKVDGDFSALLDPENEIVMEYTYAVENFKSTDSFLLLLENSFGQKKKIDSLIKEIESVSSVEEVNKLDSSYLKKQSGEKDSFEILMIKPSFKPTELNRSRKLNNKISAAIDAAGLKAGITGSYQVLLDSSESISRDMMRAALVTFTGIAVILFVFMRMPVSVVTATSFSLFISLILTLAITKLIFGRLTFMTATLPAILLGLGVDFSLHIIYSFNEKAKDLLSQGKKRDTSKYRKELITYVCKKIMRPLFIGAITTGSAFLALCAADSQGLFEMGVIGALGMGINFISAVFFLLPILSYLPVKQIAQTRRIEGFWNKLFELIEKRSFLIISMLLCLLLISTLFALKTDFNADQDSLLDQKIKSHVIQNQLLDKYSFFPVPIAIISPDEKTEKDKLKFLMENARDKIAYLESYSLARSLKMDGGEFRGKDNRLLTLVYPRENPFDDKGFKKIESLAKKLAAVFTAKGNMVTGSPFLNFGLNETVKSDLLKCTLAAVIAVAFFIFVSFRSLTRTCAGLLTVFLGIVFTVGLMGISGIDFNLMTLVVMPLIIGTGIDDGVHVLCRWKNVSGDVKKTFSGIATPITVTTATSSLAFGSLILSSNPGFRDLGFIVMSGLVFCLVISMTVLPLFLFKFRTENVV